MPVTIRDVAAKANVSPSTVSRTIRNSSSISRKTQEKVRRAMQELGYEPLSASEQPAVENRPMVGIILPPSAESLYENPFFLKVIRGITQHANSRGCLNTMITGRDSNEIIQAVKNLQDSSYNCAYILLYSVREDPVAEYLYDEGINYVQIGHPVSHVSETVSIDNDNISAGYDAAAYLHRLGHTRIGYVGSSADEVYSDFRRKGYRLFLDDNKLAAPDSYTMELDYFDPDGYEKLKDLIDPSNPDRPTALILSDDVYGITTVQLCNRMGISIPEDISLISFNNSLFSQLTSPAVTSIDVNATQLGMEAASQALNHLENPGLMPSKTLVPYQIIVRGSCLNLNTGKIASESE